MKRLTLLLIRNPVIMKPQKRPSDALNKNRKRTVAQAKLETFICCKFLRFEPQERRIHGITNGKIRRRERP